MSKIVELTIDRITDGYVIDHIRAGNGINIYRHLKLDEQPVNAALIQHVKSARLGKKDIIKIQGQMALNADMLGYLDPNATLIHINGGSIVSKQRLEPPATLTNIIECKNPRCITGHEKDVSQVFELKNKTALLYRCLYCEHDHV